MNFDANMNLDNKVWKADDYSQRFTTEVYDKYGSLDDEKEREWANQEALETPPDQSCSSSVIQESTKKEGGKEKESSGLSVDFEDDYDFVDIQDEDSVPTASRASSLTSYFGSVASALYTNAETSLAMSLTGSDVSARLSRRDKGRRGGANARRRELNEGRGSKERPLSSSSPSVVHSSRNPQQRTSVGVSTSSASNSSSSSVSSVAPPFVGHSSVALKHLYNVPIPKLRILIMAVGTRGDVQPLALLGMQLVADGHRVRLATHRSYREYVLSFGGGGLEYFPLGGDPVKLSEFMVKTHGCILPSSPDILKLVPENLSMLNDIITSCWGACIHADPGPEDGSATGAHTGRKFQADAIISNPVTYAHIHCAEALGVPLHLFFPQPWVPTKAFPHPLACMSYGKENQWSTENYLSYQLVERMMWMSLEPFINNFRTTKLKLPPIRRGEHGWNLLNTHKVPFVKMWSKHLVPVPKDWGAHVEVVGFFTDKRKKDDVKTVMTSSVDSTLQASIRTSTSIPESIDSTNQSKDQYASTTATAPPLISADTNAYEPSTALREFLEIGPPPVFVGFGSMVVDDAASLIQILLDGAALLGVRILVQSGWSEISEESFQSMTASAAKKARLAGRSKAEDVDTGVYDALLIGALPHDWLFPYLRAVIHHGGAGTTAAGLSAGKPTMICPFFGDQHFWGHMVFQAGVGPEPCSIHELTPEKVASGLKVLLSEEVGRNAKKLAVRMNAENGVKASLDSFYNHIHLENMICDVSIFHGESRVAQVWCRQCRFKMNKEVCEIVHDSSNPNNEKILGANNNQSHDIEPCVFVNWAERRQPVSTTEGFLQGVGGATHEVVGGFSDALMEPISALYNGEGVRGAMDGVVNGLQGLIIRPITGGFVLYNKVSKGIQESMNSRRSGIESKRHALPDPQRHFSRPGGITRQDDSVYGAAALSRMMNEEVTGDVSMAGSMSDDINGSVLQLSEGFEEEEYKDGVVSQSSVVDESLKIGDKVEEKEDVAVREEVGSQLDLMEERSGSVESDVLALDQVMQRTLRQSDGAAFICDNVPDSTVMTGLFHSFSTDGDAPVDFDYDSGSNSGLGSPAFSSSEILEGSSVRSGPLGLWRDSPITGTPPRKRSSQGLDSQMKEVDESVEESEVKMIFSPMTDYSSDMSEEEATVGLEAHGGEDKEVVNRVSDNEGSALKTEDSLGVSNEQLTSSATKSKRESSASMTNIEDSTTEDVKLPPLLFNSMLLTEQLHNLNRFTGTQPNAGAELEQDSNPSPENLKNIREIEILNGFLLAQKIQHTLEDVVGTTSRFITFEDFSVMLAQAMGKNWQCPEDELQAITRKLASTIAERKEFLDFVDFSLLFLSMQDEITWKDMPGRLVGKSQ